MKKFLQVMFLLFIFLTVVFYRNTIVSYISKLFFYSEGVEIAKPNEYALNYNFLFVQNTNSFYAKDKQQLYNVIYTGLNNGSESFYFFCDYDECINDVNKMSQEESYLNLNNFVHPYNSYKKLYISITNYNKITISVLKSYTEEEIYNINIKMKEIENEILNDDMTVKEKIQAFHDYIVNNTSYDSAYDENPNSKSHIAVGPLFNHVALCGGYTDSMAIFLNRLNIPNYKISSELHIWNLIFVDNRWLHLDATWDDPVTNNNTNLLLDKFFLIDTPKLKSYNTGYHNFDNNIFLEI